MKIRRTYEKEREKLLKAFDIAIDAFTKGNSGLSPEQLELIIKGYSDFRALVENPEPQFRRVASMDIMKDTILEYFQEGGGEAVEYFWKEIAKAGIDYQREENRIKRILGQGKIGNRNDYEYIKDMFVVARQEKRITSEQAIELDRMLDRYESKGLKKK